MLGIFSIAVGTPAGLGLILGGRFAARQGQVARDVGACAGSGEHEGEAQVLSHGSSL